MDVAAVCTLLLALGSLAAVLLEGVPATLAVALALLVLASPAISCRPSAPAPAPRLPKKGRRAERGGEL